jgi:tetratricopeptide (TPR) repeat protein
MAIAGWQFSSSTSSRMCICSAIPALREQALRARRSWLCSCGSRLHHILVPCHPYVMSTQEAIVHNIIREFSSHSNIVNVSGGDQYNTFLRVEAGASSIHAPSSLAFNDAPLDLLSLHFTGREKELGRISEIMDVICDDQPTRCVIHGMHGLGKTQLALQFANSAYENGRYSLIFWISAATTEKLNNGFVKILDLIRHPARLYLADQSSRLTEARRWLEDSDSNWLLVLDNVDANTLDFIRENLPHRNRRGNIFFTTRTADVASTLSNAAGKKHQVLELELPDAQDAIDLLLRECGIDTVGANWLTTSKANEVVKCVGRLPLAISQAASFMRQCHKELDYMLLLLQSEQKMQVRADSLSFDKNLIVLPLKVVRWENHLWSYEQKSVAATFACQLDDLEQHRSESSSLLRLLSYFDPESIPVDMIVLGAESLSSLQAPSNPSATTALGYLFSPLRKITTRPQEVMGSPKLKTLLALIRSPIELQDAIMQLQNRSLIKHLRAADKSILRIHDLTRIMVQDRSSKGGDEQEWFELAVALACGAFSRRVEDPESPECWSHSEQLIPHFHQLGKMSSSQNVMLTEANMAIVLYLRSCGRYNDAETLCEQVLAVRKEGLGLEHPNTLTTMRYLASVYSYQGRYSDAEALCQRVLAVREKMAETGHSETLAIMHLLADVYGSKGRYSDAETLYKQVLAAQEKIFGKEDPSTFNTMHQMAIIYRSQGRYSDAEALHKRVLAAREKILGEEHPSTLSTMHNIALVYEYQGHCSDAEMLYKRVLAAREKILGKEHPDTLYTMHSIANVYQSQGRHSDAETLYKRVLVTREKILGEEHPDTLTTMHSIALVYEYQGCYSDAETLYERVLATQEKILGEEHPDTLTTMHSIADVYRSQGHYSDAEALYKRVLGVQEQILAKGHPDTLATRHNIAQVYEYQGRYNDAEILYKRVLVVREKILGEEHPDTLTTMHNIAQVYESQERYSDAETLYKRVLAVQEKILGEEHPDTLTTMHSIADVYQSQGRHSDAETLYKRVLAVEEILGEEHPDTLTTMHNIAYVYTYQGRYGDAETLYKRVLAVQEKILGEEHPSTLTTMHNIAQVYESQGRHSDAETLYKRVLAVREKILGGEHPHTLMAVKNLADLHESLERHAHAETLCGQALQVSENKPGWYTQTHGSRGLNNPVSQSRTSNATGGMS